MHNFHATSSTDRHLGGKQQQLDQLPWGSCCHIWASLSFHSPVLGCAFQPFLLVSMKWQDHYGFILYTVQFPHPNPPDPLYWTGVSNTFRHVQCGMLVMNELPISNLLSALFQESWSWQTVVQCFDGAELCTVPERQSSFWTLLHRNQQTDWNYKTSWKKETSTKSIYYQVNQQLCKNNIHYMFWDN